MSIASTLRKAALTTFKAFKGIPVSISYYSKGNVSLSTTSGLATSTDTLYSISMALVAEYDEFKIDGVNVKIGDQKILVPGVLISFTPKIDDYIVIVSTTAKLHIVNINKDPANAVYTFQVRK